MIKIAKDKPVMIFINATSFGEADWMVPVLSCLKQHHPEWEIITVFGSTDAYDNLVKGSSLSTLFLKLSSFNVLQTQIDQLFREVVDADQVKIILKDYNNDDWAPFKSQLASRCPRALLVNFPHSTHIYTNKDTDPVKIAAKPEAWSLHDIFLLSSEHDVPHWSELVDTEKIRICGYPRYDSWWREHLVSDEQFMLSKEAAAAANSEKVFFYISRGEHHQFLDRPDYEYIVQSICEQVFSIPGSLLLIKPHPRQEIPELIELLKKYDPSRWMLSNQHLMQLASLSHVIISSWSSGILDSLATKKPVIEFWRFNDKNNWRIDPEGEKTTIYRELGLALPANTEKELKEIIESIFSNQKTFSEDQIKAFNRYCAIESNASLKTVNCLLEEVKKKELRFKKEITTPAFKMLIEEQLAYGEKLIERNAPGKAAEHFEIMRAWYPDDPRVANNAGVTKYLLGELQEAIKIFQTTLRAHPDHVDTAINLVDLFLSQNSPDNALNVILDFISSARSADAKKEIHQLAAARPFPDDHLKQIAFAMAES